MTRMSCAQGRWRSDGQPFLVVCGEIDYFRVPRQHWADRLGRLKANGANAVAAYIPWLVHEPVEGRFDFATYDLAAFVEACADAGLWLVARPGPYVYSELVCDGLPAWLWDAYPALRAKREDGSDQGRRAISYNHPLYLEKAACWYAAVLPLLVSRQVDRGGPIMALQVDNELGGVCGDDRNAVSFGIGGATGRWPDTVARRGGVAEANAAYGTTATALTAIRPPEHGGSSDGARRLGRDWQACKLRAVADYAATLTGWMRQAGVTVPIVHNASCPEAIALFRETQELGGEGFAVGTDHYWNLDQDWTQNAPTPQWLRRCVYGLDIQRSWGVPPSVWEMPAGSLSEWPPIGGRDLLAACMAHTAYGMQAVSYYIFAGGPNPPGTGGNGDLYDYGAPISHAGEDRPHLADLATYHAFLAREPWLAGAERRVDCRIVADLEQARAWAWAGQRGDLLANSGEAMDWALKGLFTTASCAGWSPEFIDPLVGDLPIDLPLLVPSTSAMPRRLQQRLAEAVRHGARVLITPVLPDRDEDFQPCTILAEAVGGTVQRRLELPSPRVAAFGIGNIPSYAPLFPCVVPAGAISIGRETTTGVDIAWMREVAGGGRVLLWGQAPRHGKHEHTAAFRAMLASLGAAPALEVDDPRIWAVLRHDGRQWLLFLINLFNDPVTVRVRFAAPDGNSQDTGSVAVPPMTVSTWPRT